MTTSGYRTSQAPAKRPTNKRAAEAERAFHEEDPMGKSVDTRLLARTWSFVKPYRLALFAGVALMPAASQLLVLQPQLQRHIVDDGILRGDLGVVQRAALMLGALMIGEYSVRFASGYLLQLVGQRTMADLRHAVFVFLLRQRMAFFDRQPIGRLVTRATNDVDALGELFASGAVTAVGDLITLATIVAAMLRLSPRLSLFTFIAVPPLVVLVEVFRRRAREAFRAIRSKTARMNAYLNEQVVGVAIVQAYGQEQRCQEEFGEINDAYRQANFLSIKYDALLFAVVEAFSSVCIASLLFVGARWMGVQGSGETLGVIVAFVQYVNRFFEPLRDMSSKYTILQSAMAGAERIFGLLDRPELDAPARADLPRTAATTDAALEFRDVRFGYNPDRPALRDVSFRVGRGRTVALVGATGAGKTTVISLVQRLYEIDAGEVLLDGVDVRALDPATLRQRVVVVPQDVVLFPGDVLSNIALGVDAPDEARAEQVAKDLGLDRLLASRGKGLRATVGERGQNFSVGERQIIALARALYRDPEILVLDEATSSMDSESEALVQSAIARTLAGRTAVVIAHRLSTIRSADEILVFHRGTIAERGDHDSLLAQGGIYARLHQLQFAGEAESAPPALTASP